MKENEEDSDAIEMQNAKFISSAATRKEKQIFKFVYGLKRAKMMLCTFR